MCDRKPLSEELRELALDHDLLWEVPRKAIEDQLIEMRDSRLSMLGRNNGLVIKEADGTSSDTIRLGPEMAMSSGLRALADCFEKKEQKK